MQKFNNIDNDVVILVFMLSIMNGSLDIKIF